MHNETGDTDFSWKIKDTEIVYRQKTPKTVNQYLLGDVLGKGSYGKVREALNTNTLDIVAIKILKKQLLRKLPGGGQASIKQEIAIAKQLKHRNVVGFIESFSNEEKGKLYIVLEYVGGGTLQELLNKAPESRLPLKQAQGYFRDLLHGIDFIHSKGIVHRDIKPGNLMITTDGILKISDFGVAEELQSFEDTSYSPKTQGSPAFQPPEIASGAEKFVGVKGDIWAAGISLYYIVTGQYPFEGSTVYTLFENIAQAKYVIPSWIEKSLADLIRGMLEPDKNKRLTVEQILKHQWLDKELENDDSHPFVEIVPTPTMFTTEFIAELAKLKTGAKHSRSARKRKNPCLCILF